MANGFENLSPKVKIKWLVKHLIAAFILMVFSYFARGPIEDFFSLEHNTLMKISFLISVIIIVAGAVLNEIYYMHYLYRLGSTEMIIKRGFIRKHEDIVPYEKIQNVSIEMGIISRILGIATLRIETAGTNVINAELEIPGIENATELGKVLIKKVETVKHDSEQGHQNNQTEQLGMESVKIINHENDQIDKIKKEFSSKIRSLEEELSQKEQKIFNMENKMSDLLDKIRIMEMKEQKQKIETQNQDLPVLQKKDKEKLKYKFNEKQKQKAKPKQKTAKRKK